MKNQTKLSNKLYEQYPDIYSFFFQILTINSLDFTLQDFVIFREYFVIMNFYSCLKKTIKIPSPEKQQSNIHVVIWFSLKHISHTLRAQKVSVTPLICFIRLYGAEKLLATIHRIFWPNLLFGQVIKITDKDCIYLRCQRGKNEFSQQYQNKWFICRGRTFLGCRSWDISKPLRLLVKYITDNLYL